VRRLVLVVVGIAAVAGWWFLGRGPELPAGFEETVDRLVLQAMEEGPIAGVSVGIERGGRVIHAKGYGFADLEHRVPATAETVYRIGSITKQFTAAAVMQLVEEDELSLDDPVTQYIPDFPTRGYEVTVRTLLNHTAGIRNVTTLEEWWDTMALELSPEQLMAVFADEPFDFRPGTRFAYSNSGYFLLGLVIERVSGQPYGGYLNEHLFVPLGLESTTYCTDHALVPNRARGYRAEGDASDDAGDARFLHATYLSMSQAYAAGAVCSSVLDLLEWSRALAGGDVVGRDGYERMTRPDTLVDGSRIEYGYGFASAYVEGHHRVSHVGGMLGFSGQIARYDEDDVSIVVLANTGDAKVAALENDLARIVLGLGDRSVKDLLLAPEELEPYTGTYDLDLARVTVAARDGRLEVDAPLPGGAARYVLLYQGEDTFQARADPEIVVRFEVEDGRADRFDLSRHGITMQGRRIDAAAGETPG